MSHLKKQRAGEKVQWLKAFTTLAGDLGSIPRIHTDRGSQISVTIPGNLTPSYGSMSIWLTCDVHPDIDAGKTLIHKSIFKKKKHVAQKLVLNS